MSDAANGEAPAEIEAEAIAGRFVVRPRPSVAFVELDGEGVLYSESSRGLHLLNPTATVIWSGFDGHRTLDELIGDLAGAFDTDPAVIREDVMALARQLGRAGLLEGVAADAEG